jgi:alpha-D-ribose 1-methylphosphonate 5-triphosphate synthase subunit PhnG
VHGTLSHAPRAARRAKPAPLAGKRQQLLMHAARTAHVQKTVHQYAAFEIGLELVFDKLRQARTGFRFDLGEGKVWNCSCTT